uniref:Uncharacterized protein n=1 Tax=Neospora caninum (strain Liverpool) TaxID=572307 RepID=A0A0F7UG75_NEOCL|nr:TPA: hypothetical protein BN1204_046915 [Neospora caninum Liverpool]
MLTTVLAVSAAVVAIQKKFRGTEQATDHSPPVSVEEPASAVLPQSPSSLTASGSGEIAATSLFSAAPRRGRKRASLPVKLSRETLKSVHSQDRDAWGYLSYSAPTSNPLRQRANSYPPEVPSYAIRRQTAPQRSFCTPDAFLEMNHEDELRSRELSDKEGGCVGKKAVVIRGKTERFNDQQVPCRVRKKGLFAETTAGRSRWYPTGRCVQKHFGSGELRQDSRDTSSTRNGPNLGNLL